ncbi:uncharacterized protein LOC127287833 [Leptopilina boulardi]|uniref:uncharacterized protein LOC127287833 n=1 Tax=Leptopilina boulardi TaxID=63433 RepID=UPI0021F5739F|nr:uncharacterized protein LOC127287833 [Leptopilina boulardi]
MTKWLLRSQDYHYDFECKPGKINRWLRGLWENPKEENSDSQEEESSTSVQETSDRVVSSDNSSDEIEENSETIHVLPISSAANCNKRRAREVLNNLLEKNKAGPSTSKTRKEQTEKGAQNNFRNRAKSDTNVDIEPGTATENKPKRERPKGKTKTKEAMPPVDFAPVASRLRSRTKTQPVVVTEENSKTIYDTLVSESSQSDTESETRLEAEDVPILRRSHSVLPSLIDTNAEDTDDESSDSDDAKKREQPITREETAVYLSPPVDTSEDEGEEDITICEVGNNSQLRDKEMVDSIRESIRRFDLSMTGHQSYFWDDEFGEKNKEEIEKVGSQKFQNRSSKPEVP